MTELELTQLFVEAAELKARLNEIETQITEAVLEIGETRKVAGITATYYKPGFATPDYESAARAFGLSAEQLAPYTTVRESVKWSDACKDFGIVATPGAPKAARVAIKY